MKTPEEYLKNVNALTLRKDLYAIGAQIQNDAYLAALKDVRAILESIEEVHDMFFAQSLKMEDIYKAVQQLESKICKEPKE